jgi:PAS domain S-box-containing protein
MYTNLDGRHSRIRMGDLKVGLIAKEKKPHLTNDLFNDPRVSDKDWARACGLISFAGYPLIVEERVVGVMALFARHSLSNATLETLASVADAIAQGIERKRAEEKLRQDECELRRITDAIPEAVGVLRPDGTVIHANKVVLDYTGMTLEDLNSPDDFRIRLFHPDDFERVRESVRVHLNMGRPLNWRYACAAKTGSTVGFYSATTPYVMMRGGSSVGMRPESTLKIASKLKRECETRTWRYVKRSITRRCSKRSSGPPLNCARFCSTWRR